MVDASKPLYVFYGSQTGCAESIAERLQSDAIERNINCPEVRPLDAFEKSGVLQAANATVVIVCSTTGNGDPPGNAEKFWRFIKKRAHPATLLANLEFTVLGLGDTNYDKFCHMGKSIFRRMKDLGAVSFYDLGCADEAMGLEDSVEPWIDGFWPALVGVISSSQPPAPSATAPTPVDAVVSLVQAMDTVSLAPSLPSLPYLTSFTNMFGTATQVPDTAKLPRLAEPSFAVSLLAPTDAIAATVAQVATDTLYSAASPFPATIAAARYLTTPASADRQVLALDLDISGSGATYVPGDVVGINCPNDAAVVDYLIQRLQLSAFQHHRVQIAPVASAKKKVAGMPFPPSATLRDIFSTQLDLAALPKKATLRGLAVHCLDADERARLFKEGAADFKRFVDDQYLSIPEVLALFQSCHPPLDVMLSLVPRLSPRYYSVASSPLVAPSHVTVAFTVVRYTQHGVPRTGLCSTWLHALAQPLLAGATSSATVPLFFKPATDFVLPEDPELPLVLVGPGTGVAPFVGFLQHRAAQNATTPMHLFFGCRRRDHDFLFQEELEQFAATGTLTSLAVAFSRAKEEKHYVQHDVVRDGAVVYRRLALENGRVYVCGDGMHMAKDVHEALVSVFETHGGLTRDEADARLKQLTAEMRYVRDIWC
ncbi:NADPH-cytochrome P450 reductase [Achlya hypogyna]|uniref:Methionine synthase reductase n=1 Tax=Achlya hypogyna TaxID=1202772 RepID=A0A1V9Z6Z9_ACHHY|nr:NADPH-cytochrome P450 reductase [Achlya hypogyna]